MAKNGINVKVKMDPTIVVQKMQEFGPRFIRRSLYKALKAVGTMWVGAVQEKIPVDSGDLRDSIGMKISTRMKLNKDVGEKLPAGKVTVGPRMDYPRSDDKQHSVGPGIYGQWVEFGLKLKKYKFTPFMRPTFDSSVDRAVQLFSDTLKAELEPAAKE